MGLRGGEHRLLQCSSLRVLDGTEARADHYGGSGALCAELADQVRDGRRRRADDCELRRGWQTRHSWIDLDARQHIVLRVDRHDLPRKSSFENIAQHRRSYAMPLFRRSDNRDRLGTEKVLE